MGLEASIQTCGLSGPPRLMSADNHQNGAEHTYMAHGTRRDHQKAAPTHFFESGPHRSTASLHGPPTMCKTSNGLYGQCTERVTQQRQLMHMAQPSHQIIYTPTMTDGQCTTHGGQTQPIHKESDLEGCWVAWSSGLAPGLLPI